MDHTKLFFENFEFILIIWNELNHFITYEDYTYSTILIPYTSEFLLINSF